MVDFVVVLQPEPNDRLSTAIAASFGQSFQSVNHTLHTPLRHLTIAISIETKTTQRTEDEGKVQLGVWTKALTNRLHALAADRGRTNELSPDRIVFPLIHVQSSSWKLYFAQLSEETGIQERSPRVNQLDQGRRGPPALNVFQGLAIGNTATAVGSFALLKALRVLDRWVREEYKWWWEGWFAES